MGENNDDRNYYAYFDDQTGQGREVFHQDLSGYEGQLPARELTPTEQDARTGFDTTRENIRNEYAGRSPVDRAQVTSQAILLEERIVAPRLVTGTPSTRPKNQPRAERRFSPSCSVWEGFRNGVNQFTPPGGGNNLIHFDFTAFLFSLRNRRVCKDEEMEKNYHGIHVLCPLREAGLLEYRQDQHTPTQGLPDWVLSTGEGDDYVQRALVEYKATHNLPLPMTAEDVVRRYNNGMGFDKTDAGESRRDFDRVCYTCAQLFAYMVINQCCYGVLTSGTRSYFFSTVTAGEGAEQTASVRVSDAWFVGEAGYLKAWAYFYSLSHRQEDRVFPTVGAKSWYTEKNTREGWVPEETRNNRVSGHTRSHSEVDSSESAGEGGPSSSRQRKVPRCSAENENRDPDVSFVRIATVPLGSVKFLGPLGYGRNGCVFHAVWEGKDVAVKQFDLGRPGGMDSFVKEIAAYELLRDAQGILIPRAWFLSGSVGGGIKHLGLQLGKDPTSEDDTSSWPRVLDTLESEFGFVHDDADRRNGLFIKDKKGSGETLVATDLESYTLTEKGRANFLKMKGSYP